MIAGFFLFYPCGNIRQEVTTGGKMLPDFPPLSFSNSAIYKVYEAKDSHNILNFNNNIMPAMSWHKSWFG
ncbi:hypothetical protein [Enterovibrio paralichthyis]|uniref:hypothetical protein n=1 Tax=Enterovibrio paralichthyis TaxID=2853805 RepID=UPI001C45FF0F|nr:hypothetical protein [Enterovibrio paralichthyis]MBV7296739.1 hypothetical protein [Enterovibrio paralichthyis]